MAPESLRDGLSKQFDVVRSCTCDNYYYMYVLLTYPVFIWHDLLGSVQS